MLGLGLNINKQVNNINYHISTWKTDNLSVGSSNNNQIQLPIEGGGTYDYTIYWGDGQNGHNESLHTYASAGTYVIKIVGQFEGFRFNNSGDRLKLLSIENWGKDFKLGNNNGYFYGCSNLQVMATDILNTDGMTTFASFFRNCSLVNHELKFSDTSQITQVESMLRFTSYNYPIEHLDLGNVTNWGAFLMGCSNFNYPIAGLNFGSAAAMYYMLYGCSSFNYPLPSNPATVIDMEHMLANCSALNVDISNIDITGLTNITGMLDGATAFSPTNYDLLLNSWNDPATPAGLNFKASSYYTAAGAAARNYLIVTKGWTITDLGLLP